MKYSPGGKDWGGVKILSLCKTIHYYCLQEGAATWGGTSFSQDQDGKVAHKFRKLMGMKEGEEEEEDDRPANEEQQLKQQQLFDQLDKEYEFARMTTHTHRGIGLGFQSLGLPDN